MLRYIFHPDGSFDIYSPKVNLMNAYPAIDGLALRPVRVTVTESSAQYELPEGALTLSLAQEDGFLAIRCHASGLENAHDIMPIAFARIDGGDRAFVQGLGMGGPSGFRPLEEEQPLESHSVLALGDMQGCMTIHARKHDVLHNVYTIRSRQLSAGFETECVALESGELPAMYLREGADFSRALRECAKEIAETMHARPVQTPAFHWCSWYYLYHTLDQATLEDYLNGFQRDRELAPFTHIQLDAGYFPSCGDWLESNERFPNGLEGAAKAILAAGYQPGIWVAPYMVGSNSRLCREHPDWLLHDIQGNLVCPWTCYNEPKPWGYRDAEFYVLDTSHPDAMAYLKRVFETMHAWGYTLFKTDFLSWGLQDSTKVRRYAPGKTSFAYFRDLMRTIRDAIGEDSRWLGCISPFMPAVGFVDMMRIGGDVGAQWEETGFGPANMLRELVADQYFNHVYWQNDPDAVMLRDFHIHLKPEQIEALALLEAMSGGAIYTSDPIHLIAEDRRKLLRLIRPRMLSLPEFPFWSEMREEICVIQRLKGRTLMLLFNPTNLPVVQKYDWQGLLGSEARFLRELHGENLPIENASYVTIPPRGCLMFFATSKPLDRIPENLWAED